MKKAFKSSVIITVYLIAVSICFFPAGTFGQTFNFKQFDHNVMHTADSIKAHGLNDTIIVSHSAWDDMVSNSSSWASYIKFKSVHDIVRFSVNHRYPFKIFSPYTLRLTYKVYGFSNPATPNTATSPVINDTLTISFNPDSLALYQDKQYKKYSNYHKIMIVLTGLYKIDGAGGTPTPVTLGPGSTFNLLNFNVEGAVLFEPYNTRVKNGSNFYTAYGASANLKIDKSTATHDYLPVVWKPNGMTIFDNLQLNLLPVKYELEWTYVDNYKVDPYNNTTPISTKSASNLSYSFVDNATKVWVDTNYYKIPLIYQKGYVIYRVRLVRPDSSEYKYPIYGPWTLASTGTVSGVASNNIYQIDTAHLSDSLNWQYTVSFAEQGKYKHVMSYYDGMLKNRQSITRFNSTPGKLIATEQIYDYEGRPSISILPTPVNSPSFRYQLKLALNKNTGNPYQPQDFDTVQLTSCPADILLPPLHDSSLADIYYSPNNPDKSGYQKFVPDAGGFPLVQTVYSPGYDERVEKQGGAGDTLQIGYKHNIKNDYVGTEQNDLNRYFGTNIGWTEYYRKTVARDPNGQLSLNITNYKGKTMMSSMVGLPDTTIHALVSNENLADSVQYTDDFLAGTTQQIIGNKRILDKNFFNEAAGNNTAKYVYKFKPFETFCIGKYLTVKAQYDYRIFDECGVIVAHSDSVLGYSGVVTSGSQVAFEQTPPLGFYMEKGTHSLHKELTINTDDVAFAVDTFMSLPTTENCLKDEPWFIKQSVLSKQFPCPENYVDLDCPSCGSKKYEMIQELYPNQDSAYIKRKYGVYHTINGVVIGNNNSDFTIYCGTGTNPNNWHQEFTAEDVLTGGGEGTPYPGGLTLGNWENLNQAGWGPTVFPAGPYIILNGTDTLNCKYRYQNACITTMPDTIIRFGNIYTNLQQLPVEDFINIFDDSIAEALLPLHPEYCKMLDCVDDPYAKKLRKIPNADIADQLGMMKLADIIANDPIHGKMMAYPALFPNPFDTMAYLQDGYLCLDTIAFNQAYCQTSIGNMLEQCQSEMFQSEIASGTLINDYVKEKYFEAIRNIYLSNRARYLYILMPGFPNGIDCSICDTVRMHLIPEPVFPNNDSIYYTLLDNITTAVNNTSTTVPVTGLSVVNQYLSMLDTIDMTGYQNASDSAVGTYIGTSNTLMNAVLDSMMAQFTNCLPAANLDNVRDYLENLYNTGQVINWQFTPEQVTDALVSNGINMDDLCNPYIVSYDKLMAPPDDYGSGGIKCGNVSMFDGITEFLNGLSLSALQNPGNDYFVPLTGGNPFATLISQQLGNVNTCIANVEFNSQQQLYTISYSRSGLTVKVSLKASQGGTFVDPFIPGSGETVSLQAYCMKEIYNAFPSGYIADYSFAVVAKHESSSSTHYYNMKAWNDKITINNLGENPISECVPCTEMKKLYLQFRDTCTAYNVKGVMHPYYKTMLKNFMNYRLKRAFTDEQYIDFVESCALADSMTIKDMIVFQLVFGDSTAAFTFVDALNNYDPVVNIIPLYVYRISGSNYKVGISLKDIPKNKLRLFYDYIHTYPCTSHALNVTFQDIDDESYLSTVFVPVGTTLSNSVVFPGAPNSLTFYNIGTYDAWNGTAFTPCYMYSIYTPNINDFAGNNRKMATLEQYVYNHTASVIFLHGIQHSINSEYYLPEKQGYLQYAYYNQSLPSITVLDKLQVVSLESGIPVLNGKVLSYGHPAQPSYIQNLYIGDPSTATDNTHYDKLQYILSRVMAHFGGGIFFTGPNTVNIPVGTGMLTAFRCRDTAFWYRYFDTGDTMYNVFIRTPEYIDTNYLPGYMVQDYGFNLGDDNSRSFHITLNNTSSPVPDLDLNGFTDFTVAKNKVLHNVLLDHAIGENSLLADTVDNCERDLLNTAVYEGKIKYKFYIDSIRERLYADFYDYIMNEGISENLFISYRNQRFNYTLYNYDRAGNLTLTVPPAGVFPVPSPNLSLVDDYRTNPSAGNIIPPDAKISEYKYNTLNQVVYQKTPDGGATDFYYDAAGRVIFSQNDKQKPSGKMTYTLYDKQGRIVETGQAKVACPYFTPIYPATVSTVGPPCSYYDPVNHKITCLPPIVTSLAHKSNEEIIAYVRSKDREEVVLTNYDTVSVNIAANLGYSPQENLRKRVATIKYFDFLGTTDSAAANYTYAMHFSYDIAGNVKTLTRDYPEWKNIGQRFKRVDYDYDVISGKVNLLSYNRGFADQFYQKYSYDDDNRITEVNTSNDGIIWQRDASYQYYQHGPLARISVGDLRVQGVDYAYTIQGWLKAINGDQLNPQMDMGEDAIGNSVHANDAVALTLDYFKGDYKPIGDTAVMHIAAMGKNMYNGNIPRATTSILPFPDLASTYTYDQLNRIVRADYANMSRATADLTTTADYYSSYAYDPDGNLKKLVRNGNNPSHQQMDSMRYYYGSYTNYSTNNNKLVNITDMADDNYSNDIRKYVNQYTNRYNYDPTGNVTQDLVSGQDDIVWNHYNKVTRDFNGTQNQTLGFQYDGAGNRYLKSVSQSSPGKDSSTAYSDYYVRDAQGNILAIYKNEANYAMTKQQWIEYITASAMVLCNPKIYIRDFINPFYSYNSYFRDHVLQVANTNDSWVHDQITDSAVSFYMSGDPTIFYNTVSGAYSANHMFGDMALYDQANNINVLGDNLNNWLSNNDEAHNKFLHDLCSNNLQLNPDFVQLLCSTAPDLLEGIMSDYSIDGYNPHNCDVNDSLLNKYIIEHGIEPVAFFSEINAAGKDFPTAFNSFLAGLYNSATLFHLDNDELTAYQLLCLKAPNAFRAAMNAFGIPKHDDCDADIREVDKWVGESSNNLAYFNNTLSTDRDNTDELNNFIGSLIYDNNAVTETDVLQNVFTHLCETMPELTEALMDHTELDYQEDVCVDNAKALKDYFTQNATNHALLTDVVNWLYDNRSNYDNKENYPMFIDSIASDTAILNDAYYTGSMGAVLMPVLIDATLNYTNWTDVVTFFDNWDQARTLMERNNDGQMLLGAAYHADPAQFMVNFMDVSGNHAILTESLAAIPNLTLDLFTDYMYRIQDHYCLHTFIIDSIVHTAYVNALQSRRFSLSSHHLYGSSRLGTKDYLPGEFYRMYAYADTTIAADTLTLSSLRPWYSLEFNDLIAGLQLEPYNATDFSTYFASHRIGEKQYELTNHLGNVQGTVSDLPFPYGEYNIEGYHPAMPATYDYYPFGMLMPGRFTSDTTSKCTTITQTKWITKLVDSCYDVYNWVWPFFTKFDKATAGVLAGTVVIGCDRVNEWVSFRFPSTPNTEQILELDVNTLTSGSGTLEVAEDIGGNWNVLATANINKAGLFHLNYTPTMSDVRVRFLGPIVMKVNHICIKKKVQVQESYLVDICNSYKDKYRFGFNGQEKVNEWAGIGNFMEFKERGQDTRIGRFLSVDPLAKKYPWNGSYNFAEDRVIDGKDLEGLEYRYSADGTYLGQGSDRSSQLVMLVTSKQVKGKTVTEEHVLTFNYMAVNHEEFQQYASTIYNETYQGPNAPNVDKSGKLFVADAIVNKGANLGTEYPALRNRPVFLQMTLDKVMINGDSHEKRMSAERQNPSAKALIPGTKLKLNRIRTLHYAEFYNSSLEERNQNPEMKASNEAAIQGLLRTANDEDVKRTDDSANGEANWTGNGTSNAPKKDATTTPTTTPPATSPTTKTN
ncbi:hypothetical protein F0919_15630 [Taibaiella lutea]|uniref:RHS repeat-associated core domain-containing protein n=1 Tax=Taibaiella lutea TaxID=2608001 RepID=A0A5M6CAN0_9BACT|nr:hypothetical protein [Taibaiella lutea]KAA5532228.1 hypothetical protein F0919_15630 [Taibaiella lutea]